MTSIYWQIVAQIGAALAAGGIIGLERTYHGRPAGFRTHALVCLAAAAAVSACAAPTFLPGAFPGGSPRLDPTRLAQGVMTGIGFLGAGVIFKEGFNIQGLTTAASVWATAAVGVLLGTGSFYTAGVATVGILAALVVFRWIEDRLPAEIYAFTVLRFRAADAPDEVFLQKTLRGFGVSLREISHARTRDGALLEFSGNITAARESALVDLAAHLRAWDGLVEYDLSRISR